MIYAIAIILVLILIYGPQLWVQWILNRHNRKPEENFPGTGGELARHLLDRYDLQEVKVEISDLGDHYDPMTRAVRLTRMLRTRLASISVTAQRVGSFLLFAAPFAVLITRLPSAAVFNITGAFLIMGFAIVMHLLTLPVEIDASFKKALPLLSSGYLSEKQMPAARSILRAAAWTYVAASLATLLNFWRWLAVLRR
jgi:Zn-dependent membrane protease YugP